MDASAGGQDGREAGGVSLRERVGEVVHVAFLDGHDLEGTLLNVNRRSLWLVAGDADVLIPWGDIADVR